MKYNVVSSAQMATITGVIKWFNPIKGFGFIIPDEGGADILLPKIVLQDFGQSSVAEQSRITLYVQATERGMQAVEIISLTPPPSENFGTSDFDDEAVPLLPARVKWFDTAKGFGFANIYGNNEDVFLHIDVMRKCGLSYLEAGEAISIKIKDRPTGLIATGIYSWGYAVAE